MSDKIRDFLLSLFNHRFLAMARWEFHFLRLRSWNFLTGQRRRIQRDLASRNAPLFLNLGSGPRGRGDRHWVNIDAYPDKNVEYLIDFCRTLPFATGTFDGAFCEHVLEHFSMQEGLKIASDVRRVLQPGGSFRIVVPDGELVMRRYFEAPEELIARRGDGIGTAMEQVNTYFRQRYEHQFIYDWTTMEKMLREAGFDQVARVSFGRGACAPIVLDDQKYEWESLYVEARRS
jgi:predicted SAM-dependent methyltransferase